MTAQKAQRVFRLHDVSRVHSHLKAKMRSCRPLIGKSRLMQLVTLAHQTAVNGKLQATDRAVFA